MKKRIILLILHVVIAGFVVGMIQNTLHNPWLTGALAWLYLKSMIQGLKMDYLDIKDEIRERAKNQALKELDARVGK
jgi:hypothetical protein